MVKREKMATLTIDKTKRWTADDYKQLDEDVKCEIIDAELIMTPAPNTNHQKVSMSLIFKIRQYIEIKKKGILFHAPTDIYFDERNVFQPDLIYVDDQHASIIREKGIEGVPDLIIEIISPSNSYIDRYIKKGKYAQFGVKEYWIVDPANKTLEVFSLDQGQEYGLFLFLAEGGEVKSALLKDLSFELKEIFQ